MKSKASINGHSLHQILVNFPIAFFSGTLFFDVLGLLYPNLHIGSTPYYLNLAAILMASLAAVPGIIDYHYTVPPNSSAKSRGLKHGMLNVSVLVLFIIAFTIRDTLDDNKGLIISIEALGVILMGIAGWLGGTLVSRNQIGIDIRYARAGRWKQLNIKNAGRKNIPVALVDELKQNQMKLVMFNDKRIVIAKGESDTHYAFEDRCSHRGGSLAGGALICNTVQCPWHGSQFDIKTGNVKAGPALAAIKTYSVKVEEGVVYIDL